MPRLAFRRILPIVMLALTIALFLVEHARIAAEWAAWDACIPHCLPPDVIGKPLPALFPAVAVNAPVDFVLHPPLAYLWDRYNLVGLMERGLNVVYGFGVLLLWYFVGFWVDNCFGLRISPTERKIHQILVRLALSTSFVLVIVFSGHVFSLVGYYWQGKEYFWLSLVPWSAFGLLVLGLSIYRWQFARKAALTPP